MSNAYSEMREKVALSLARCMGHDNWRRWTTEADAAISATIQGLIEMTLPTEAENAADEAALDFGTWEPEFRAILTALKPLFTKEEAQS